jgi:hypothetical protein
VAVGARAMVGYFIPDVPLIPQTNAMACWYASAQMLIAWRRNRTGTKESRHPDPSQVPSLAARCAANRGLKFAQNVALAQMLGLTPVPPVSPTPATIANWLASNGPLWFDCITNQATNDGHAVVITGVGDQVVIMNDPLPVMIGTRNNRLSMDRFYELLQPLGASSPAGAPSAPLAPNFLYLDEPTPDATAWSLMAAYQKSQGI